MKLFILRRKAIADYDEYQAFIIIAKNRKEARELANKFSPIRYNENWLDSKKFSCREINLDKVKNRRILLESIC